MADEGGQDFLQLKEETLAGFVTVGVHGEGDPSRPPLFRGGVERCQQLHVLRAQQRGGGSMAQQSEQPSVM